MFAEILPPEKLHTCEGRYPSSQPEWIRALLYPREGGGGACPHEGGGMTSKKAHT